MTVLVRVPLEHDVITDPVEEEKQTKKVFECERLSLWINYRLTRVLNSEPIFSTSLDTSFYTGLDKALAYTFDNSVYGKALFKISDFSFCCCFFAKIAQSGGRNKISILESYFN